MCCTDRLKLLLLLLLFELMLVLRDDDEVMGGGGGGMDGGNGGGGMDGGEFVDKDDVDECDDEELLVLDLVESLVRLN